MSHEVNFAFLLLLLLCLSRWAGVCHLQLTPSEDEEEEEEALRGTSDRKRRRQQLQQQVKVLSPVLS